MQYRQRALDSRKTHHTEPAAQRRGEATKWQTTAEMERTLGAPHAKLHLSSMQQGAPGARGLAQPADQTSTAQRREESSVMAPHSSSDIHSRWSWLATGLMHTTALGERSIPCLTSLAWCGS